MSYILEALKKAQAERQLGSAPTIHTPTVHAAPVAGAGRRPLAIGFAAGAVLVAAALLFWRQHGTAPVAPAPAVAPGQPVAAQPAVTVAQPGAGAQVALVHDREADSAAERIPHPRVQTPKPTVASQGKDANADDRHQVRSTVRVADAPKLPAAAPAPVQAAAAPVVQAPVAAAASEDTVRTLNELPDAVRNSVPRVAFGGYMYSPNPADRLVLVDKVLRHEGEEVAPGLMLEKLLPRGAVLNYRGYRYRVAF